MHGTMKVKSICDEDLSHIFFYFSIKSHVTLRVYIENKLKINNKVKKMKVFRRVLSFAACIKSNKVLIFNNILY